MRKIIRRALASFLFLNAGYAVGTQSLFWGCLAVFASTLFGIASYMEDDSKAVAE